MMTVYGTDMQPPDPKEGQGLQNNKVFCTSKLSIEDYFIRYAVVRKKLHAKAKDNGECLAKVVAFMAQFDIRESHIQDCKTHYLWYVAIDCYFDLHYQHQDNMKEIFWIYKEIIK